MASRPRIPTGRVVRKLVGVVLLLLEEESGQEKKKKIFCRFCPRKLAILPLSTIMEDAICLGQEFRESFTCQFKLRSRPLGFFYCNLMEDKVNQESSLKSWLV